jgi:hypothetical protein
VRLLETHQEVAVEPRPRLVVPMFVGGLVNFVGLDGAGMQALRRMALSHAAGLPEVAGVAMGIGAMTCAMLGLPLTAVLLTTIFMGSDGLNVMPIVIVAVVVAYVGRAHFSPKPSEATTQVISAPPPPARASAEAA